RPPRFPPNAKGFPFAPTAWLGWVVALYAGQGAASELGPHGATLVGTSWLRVVLGALTGLAVAAIGPVGWRSFFGWRKVRAIGVDAGGRPIDQSHFLGSGARLHAGLFMVAVIWTGTAILIAGELCGP